MKSRDRRGKSSGMEISAIVRVARGLSRVVLQAPCVGPLGKRLSHKIAGASGSSPLRILAPLRSTLKGEVEANRVIQIVDALERFGIPCCLAGGWGVDALVGHQTRRHDDADVVIDDFEQQASKACEALSLIGFRLVERHHQPVWLPDQWTLEDDRGSRIDLLSLDWDRLATTMTGAEAVAERWSGPRLRMAAVTEGTVGSQRVPCLAADVQRLFHSGFELRVVHHHDMNALGTRRM